MIVDEQNFHCNVPFILMLHSNIRRKPPTKSIVLAGKKAENRRLDGAASSKYVRYHPSNRGQAVIVYIRMDAAITYCTNVTSLPCPYGFGSEHLLPASALMGDVFRGRGTRLLIPIT